MSRRRRQTGRALADVFPIGKGAALGIVAYVLGYIVTYILVQLSSNGRSLGLFAELTDISKFDIAGWMFYNAHFVDVTATTSAGSLSDSESTNLLAEASDLVVPEPVWHLVPIVFLILAGFVVAMTITDSSHTGKAAAAGATVLVGYLPLTFIGLFLFGTSMEFQSFVGTATIAIGPNKVLGILLTGLVFPILFGMVGGLLASTVSTGGRPTERREVSRYSR